MSFKIVLSVTVLMAVFIHNGSAAPQCTDDPKCQEPFRVARSAEDELLLWETPLVQPEEQPSSQVTEVQRIMEQMLQYWEQSSEKEGAPTR